MLSGSSPALPGLQVFNDVRGRIICFANIQAFVLSKVPGFCFARATLSVGQVSQEVDGFE